MLAAQITLAHFSVSSAMSLLKSAGEPGSTVPPKATFHAEGFVGDQLPKSAGEPASAIPLRSANRAGDEPAITTRAKIAPL